MGRTGASGSIRTCLLALASGLALDTRAAPAPEGAPRAFGEAAADATEPRVAARLLVDPGDADARTAPRIGVLFDIDPGWHIYGQEPGDVGLPTRLAWRVDGATVGPTRWPEPQVFRDAEAGLTSYGYEGRVLLQSPLELAAWRGGVRRAHVDVDFLVCKTECIPGRLSLARDLDEALAADASAHVRFAAYDGGGETGALPAAPATDTTLLAALAFAFLGGLILNLMPCVLPVLALKAFALADLAGKSRREVLAHGAGYTAGVLATLLALGVLVSVLRAAGASVGWGFQFQEPAYSLGLAALLVVLALNLFGVFEVAAPAGLASVGANAAGVTRSFCDGLLAVALATPCSAPFLGTAVGFAFASPPVYTLGVFAALGLGLAAPLASIALLPGLARVVPRSGPWMLQLRVVLGFALLASAAWLLWVFGRLVGTDRLGAALGWLVALALAAWLFGTAQAAGRARRGLVSGVLVAVVAFAVLRPLAAAQPPLAAEAAGEEVYVPEAVGAHLAAGRPVFVTFTADWCLTCKANERGVIASPRVQAELLRGGYAVMKADWTRRDDAIRRELARFGKAGVPLYVVFDPRRPEQPRVLPELLTVDLLVDALRATPDDGA